MENTIIVLCIILAIVSIVNFKYFYENQRLYAKVRKLENDISINESIIRRVRAMDRYKTIRLNRILNNHCKPFNECSSYTCFSNVDGICRLDINTLKGVK